MRLSRVLLWFCFWTFCILATAEVVLRSNFIWKIETLQPYLFINERDHWTKSTINIVKDRTDGKKHDFYLLGGSICLESLYSEKDLQKRISIIRTKESTVRIHCGSYRSFVDDYKVINNVGWDKTFVFFLEPEKLISPKEKDLFKKLATVTLYKFHSFPLDSQYINQFSEGSTQINFWNQFVLSVAPHYWGQLLHARFNRLLRGHPQNLTYVLNSVFANTPMTKDRQVTLEAKLRNKAKQFGYKKDMKRGVELLSFLLQKITNSGGSIIFVNFPTNPFFQDLYNPEIEKHYSKVLQDLHVQFPEIELLNYRDLSIWKAEHFRDSHHIIQQGRRLFTEIFSQDLANISSRTDKRETN